MNCLLGRGITTYCAGKKVCTDNCLAVKRLELAKLALTGVMEVRLNYHSTHLNVKKLDKDLQDEWEVLYKKIDA